MIYCSLDGLIYITITYQGDESNKNTVFENIKYSFIFAAQDLKITNGHGHGIKDKSCVDLVALNAGGFTASVFFWLKS
ncbi:hypothetical protein MCERE19_03828 [Spirosomataceae bacterium]|jgi:hypothetical protein